MAISKKTTISVPEMRKLLGLKKTESYWLVHKNVFRTVTVAGQMRIVLDSFEDWYVNQTHYKKVGGPLPGEKLERQFYSVHDISEMLGISTDSVYELLKKYGIKTITNSNLKWVRRNTFNKWLRSQNHYRTQTDKDRDREAEESSMTIPEMGRLICIDRNKAYKLVERTPELKIILIAGRRRITKDSFESWYAAQSDYRKFSELSEKEKRKLAELHKDDPLWRKLLAQEENNYQEKMTKSCYSVQETAEILGCSETSVLRLIDTKEIAAMKVSGVWKIMKEEIMFLIQKDCSR